ncbi:hypothetical protein S7711_05634 [Stachybotrys chartarum IBT 7711]|uniref:Uncharacterized protein n=1 Tax=Stachybotrys chartarum (strain CBS 109288 / IBT 7711) TaxID=1280523 RepID=A0A084B4T5_STACB|nr:hypothetical protein S7711_05634 [Stachybotrys chartarum IBT 7711]KFA53554.1 hypothetical protein S40293_09140 [Stachybotrys chartarum IBT 40293]KFA72334.1 hypothetical protein S40288_09323 [Stachybotrys chartarum IBT 40288]
MPIRNPFARRPGAAVVSDENMRPEVADHPTFERVDTVGSKASSVLTIRSTRSQDNGEYKMSDGTEPSADTIPAVVVNDSGVYLPPSPSEEKGQWPRNFLSSRTSTEGRNSPGDIEHFPISRESFDSYRRSFDITARSQIFNQDATTRQSLDSARFPRMPRASVDRRMDRSPPTPEEENFEDVGLDDQKNQAQSQPLPQRKRGFFSKFSDANEKESNGQPMSRFLGRKRGQSGQGAELGNIDHFQQQQHPKVMVTSEE